MTDESAPSRAAGVGSDPSGLRADPHLPPRGSIPRRTAGPPRDRRRCRCACRLGTGPPPSSDRRDAGADTVRTWSTSHRDRRPLDHIDTTGPRRHGSAGRRRRLRAPESGRGHGKGRCCGSRCTSPRATWCSGATPDLRDFRSHLVTGIPRTPPVRAGRPGWPGLPTSRGRRNRRWTGHRGWSPGPSCRSCSPAPAGLHQPLSGEVRRSPGGARAPAVRRGGCGVEGLLLHYLRQRGPQGLVQVGLDERHHRHPQPRRPRPAGHGGPPRRPAPLLTAAGLGNVDGPSPCRRWRAAATGPRPTSWTCPNVRRWSGCGLPRLVRADRTARWAPSPTGADAPGRRSSPVLNAPEVVLRANPRGRRRRGRPGRGHGRRRRRRARHQGRSRCAPTNPELPVEVELDRLLPVLEAVRRRVGPGVTISVDTYRSRVAEAALRRRASIVNDPSGLRDEMADLVASTRGAGAGPSIVVAFNPSTPRCVGADERLDDPVEACLRFVDERIDRLTRAGGRSRQLILDQVRTSTGARRVGRGPAAVPRLRSELGIGRVLWAVSRKDFVGALTGRMPHQRGFGDPRRLAVDLQDRDLIRVHDVARDRRLPHRPSRVMTGSTVPLGWTTRSATTPAERHRPAWPTSSGATCDRARPSRPEPNARPSGR